MRSRTSIWLRWSVIHLLLSLLLSAGLPRPLYAQSLCACDSGTEKTLADSDAASKDAPPLGLAKGAEAPPPNEVGSSKERKEAEEKLVNSASKLKAQLRAQVLVVSPYTPSARTRAFDPKEASRYRVPAFPQTGSGKKVKKGPLIVGLIGLGLLGSGAYLFSTYQQPTTLVGLLDEEPTNRRAMGSAMMGLGATLAAIGFLSMR